MTTQALEITRIGVRAVNQHPPTFVAIPAGTDPYYALAVYVERWINRGAQIVNSHGVPGQVAVRECSGSVLENGVLRIRIVDAPLVTEEMS